MLHCRFALVCLLEISAVLCAFEVPVLSGQEVGSAQFLFSEEREKELFHQWSSSDTQSQKLVSERIGESGSERLACQKGWRQLLSPEDKGTGHRWGFDQVWIDQEGHSVVIESKGGDSRLREGYGERQGTMKWCVKTARETLENRNSSEREIAAAQKVLDDALEGNAKIYTIHTSFDNNGKLLTKIKNIDTSASYEVRQLAQATLNDIRKLPQVQNKALPGSQVAARSGSSSARTADQNAKYLAEAYAKDASSSSSSATRSRMPSAYDSQYAQYGKSADSVAETHVRRPPTGTSRYGSNVRQASYESPVAQSTGYSYGSDSTYDYPQTAKKSSKSHGSSNSNEPDYSQTAKKSRKSHGSHKSHGSRKSHKPESPQIAKTSGSSSGSGTSYGSESPVIAKTSGSSSGSSNTARAVAKTGSTYKTNTKASESLASEASSYSSTAQTTGRTASAARAAGKGAKAARGLSKTASGLTAAAGVVGVGADIAVRAYEYDDLERQYQNGEISRQERDREQTKTVTGAVGGYSGAAVGTWAGAAAGAAVGSVVPIVGTALGGAIGGFLGWMGGYSAGESVSNAIVDDIYSY